MKHLRLAALTVLWSSLLTAVDDPFAAARIEAHGVASFG